MNDPLLLSGCVACPTGMVHKWLEQILTRILFYLRTAIESNRINIKRDLLKSDTYI